MVVVDTETLRLGKVEAASDAGGWLTGCSSTSCYLAVGLLFSRDFIPLTVGRRTNKRRRSRDWGDGAAAAKETEEEKNLMKR